MLCFLFIFLLPIFTKNTIIIIIILFYFTFLFIEYFFIGLYQFFTFQDVSWIYILLVYTTTRKWFVIFTSRYFKFSWNTTALSQSNWRLDQIVLIRWSESVGGGGGVDIQGG